MPLKTLSQACVQIVGAGKVPTSLGSWVNVHLCLGLTEMLKAAPAIKELHIQTEEMGHTSENRKPYLSQRMSRIPGLCSQ